MCELPCPQCDEAREEPCGKDDCFLAVLKELIEKHDDTLRRLDND